MYNYSCCLEESGEIPGSFAISWEQRKLGDVLDDMYNGQTPSRNKSGYWNGNIKWLSSGELNRGTVYDSIETITEDGQKSANLRIVPNGTFIMAITGLEAAGTRGNCALLGFDTTLNQSCMALFPKKDLLTSDFLFQWYRKIGEEYGLNYTQGTKQQSYNAELIKILPISLPSVTEQKKIASYLRNLDHLITLHQRKQCILYIMEKILCGKSKQLGKSISWEQRKLGELGEIMTGSTPSTSKSEYYSEDGIPWVTPTDINALTISDTSRKLSEKGMEVGRVVPANTILCTCIASIGKNALLTVKGSFNQQINSLTPSAENDAYFLLTESELWSKKMKQIAASGTMQIVNKTEFSELTTLIPAIDEQMKIGEHFKTLDHLITLHQRKP